MCNRHRATRRFPGTYPDRPVRAIVPFPAGGAADIVARHVAQKLTEAFGVQFIVDNRAGAGGAIGAELVARAAPDGYTLQDIGNTFDRMNRISQD
jgi:tripartite-type tricarboxylate transporter receptor subunit TctC